VNRKKFLVVHGADPKRWCERHDLEFYTRPCSDCGAPCTTSVPFASGQFRGLLSPQCACGNKNTPFVFVRDSKYGDLLSGGVLR
jgi:hypothetical protein